VESVVKVLIRSNAQLAAEGRWDLDYHLPPELIERYPEDRRRPVSQLARISKEKRDPAERPDSAFIYVDISSVDVEAGAITNPQELTGEEAPSRARMVIRAYDVIVSTCRPTRGAIAVVPPELHNQICSTGFAVVRCKENVNPFFLQYVLRLPSTLEQFRKFSTGSSYPAILETDVLKTLVPYASSEEQDIIAASIVSAFEAWKRIIHEANESFKHALSEAEAVLRQADGIGLTGERPTENGATVSIAAIREALATLNESSPPAYDGGRVDEEPQQSLI
jgi:hypothetical protein